MSIDYKQLQNLVREAMFTGGGINEPSAPEGVPHRMPASESSDKQQDMGDPKANELYEVALVAREATEKLVEALDEPQFDGAYEHAFKASACLRRALNSLEGSGAHPMPIQRIVAPPRNQQKYTGGGAGDYYGSGTGTMAIGLEEEIKGLGQQMVSKTQQAKATVDRAKNIRTGDTLGDVDNRERGMLQQIEQALTKIADQDDLIAYRPQLQSVLKTLLKLSQAKVARTQGTKNEN